MKGEGEEGENHVISKEMSCRYKVFIYNKVKSFFNIEIRVIRKMKGVREEGDDATALAIS